VRGIFIWTSPDRLHK